MKYKLTDDTIIVNEKILHRIECVTAFGDVRTGDKGGYVESETNLSQNGTAWIFGNAKVYGNATVYGNAMVYYNACVYDNAMLYGNAKVCDNARVCDNAMVSDNAKVVCNAMVYGNVIVNDNAFLRDNAKVCDNARVCDNAWVSDNAMVCGDAKVCGEVWVCGDAKVCDNADYIVFKNHWSSGRHFTWTRSNDMWKVGCFYGTGEELIGKAYKDSENCGKHYEAYVKFVEQLKALESYTIL